MASISILSANTRFYISTVPAMPQITLQAMVQGVPLGTKLDFSWTAKLEYNDFIAVTGARRRNVTAKVHPAIAPLKGNPVTINFASLMCGVLTVTVQTVFNGTKLSATRTDILIGGANPSPAELKMVVTKPIVRKMIRQESGGKQFSDSLASGWTASAINPNWSSDNLCGVGLGQLTNPPPSDADIWNWRTNAQDLQSRFVQKRSSGATLHTRMAASQRFTDELKALNDWRAAEGQKPVLGTLAALNESQMDGEGLRAYNGFGIQVSGQYLSYVHEYEPATTVLISATRKAANGLPLKSPKVLDVDASGNAKWVQVSGADRLARYGGRRIGEPDYVAKVLAQPD